nr:glutamate-1-semialdehyde 2,1-aminomutase, chloroplastic [Tanacetum cinerariifolium]
MGPAIIGHANDEVLAALAETMKKGTSFGAPCLLENVLAEMVISVPNAYLVKAGSGVATLGLPDSSSVPKAATLNTLTAPTTISPPLLKSFPKPTKVKLLPLFSNQLLGIPAIIRMEMMQIFSLRISRIRMTILKLAAMSPDSG